MDKIADFSDLADLPRPDFVDNSIAEANAFVAGEVDVDDWCEFTLGADRPADGRPVL